MALSRMLRRPNHQEQGGEDKRWTPTRHSTHGSWSPGMAVASNSTTLDVSSSHCWLLGWDQRWSPRCSRSSRVRHCSARWAGYSSAGSCSVSLLCSPMACGSSHAERTLPQRENLLRGRFSCGGRTSRTEISHPIDPTSISLLRYSMPLWSPSIGSSGYTVGVFDALRQSASAADIRRSPRRSPPVFCHRVYRSGRRRRCVFLHFLVAQFSTRHNYRARSIEPETRSSTGTWR